MELAACVCPRVAFTLLSRDSQCSRGQGSPGKSPAGIAMAAGGFGSGAAGKRRGDHKGVFDRSRVKIIRVNIRQVLRAWHKGLSIFPYYMKQSFTD